MAGMSTRDSDRESFRPWGWPAVNALLLFVMVAAVLFFMGPWSLVLFSPAWGYALFVMVLTMCVRITIVDGDLAWRTVIGSGVVTVGLAMTVRPAPKWGYGTIRIVDFADGQSIRVGEGPEFDRLLRSLKRRVHDIEVEDLSGL